MKRSIENDTHNKRLKSASLSTNYLELHPKEFQLGLSYIIDKDPSLLPIIQSSPFTQYNSKPVSTTNEAYLKLIWTIIGQQIHGKAARSIELKFMKLFDDEGIIDVEVQKTIPRTYNDDEDSIDFKMAIKITPEKVLLKDDSELKTCGLSTRKISYIKHISEVFNKQEITIEFLTNSDNDEIVTKLIELKGIGEWSAKMFLMFALHKYDVFTTNDLGVCRGFAKYIETRPELLKNLDIDWSLYKKKGSFQDGKKRNWKVHHDAYLDKISEIFKPYRSLFMLILWRLSSTNLDTF